MLKSFCAFIIGPAPTGRSVASRKETTRALLAIAIGFEGGAEPRQVPQALAGLFVWSARPHTAPVSRRRTGMPISLATLVSFMFLAASGALAQTTAPSPAPAATAGGIGDYWWLIVVVLVIAAAAWYFMRGRTTTRL